MKRVQRRESTVLTVREAAAALGLQTSTIRKWIARRQVPYVRVGERAIRISAAWVEEQLTKGLVNPIRLEPAQTELPYEDTESNS